MPAPQSNFRLATNDAWLIFRGTSGNWGKARTNGKTFVTLLQRTLRISPALLTSQVAYDGTRIVGTDITADGEWADKTNKALWVFLRANGATSTTLQVVELAGRAHQITRETMTIAANLLLKTMGYATPDPRIPANAVLPLYRTPLPGTVGSIFTGSATADELTAVGVSQPSTGTGTGATGSTGGTTDTGTGGSSGGDTGGKQDSGAGDDSGTGGKDPSSLPTGITPTVTTSHGLTSGAVFAALGAVAVLGLIGVSLMKSGPARANPAYGPRLARAYLEREPLDRGGYTRRGRYFGIGAPLYRLTGEDLVDRHGRAHAYVDEHLRAADRDSAMRIVRERYPNVRFTGRS